MIKNIVLIFFIVLGLATAQLGLISGLPDFWRGLNLITTAMIFALVFYNFETAVYIVAGAGLVRDIYSFSPFGLHLGSLFFTLLAVNFLYRGFFTNRSVFSFAALAAIADLAYIILEAFGRFAFDYSGQSAMREGIFMESIYSAILNAILAAIIFYLLNFLSRRFKPVFLYKSKSGMGKL